MYAARYRRKVGGAAADTEKTDPCIDAARRAVESVGEDCGGAAGRRREQDGGDRESGLRNDPDRHGIRLPARRRSEEHTSEPQSLMRISYAVFCLKKQTDHSR